MRSGVAHAQLLMFPLCIRMVNKIVNDDDLAERFAHNGQTAVLEHYNWENEAVKLLDDSHPDSKLQRLEISQR